jgi:hypothetical protein
MIKKFESFKIDEVLNITIVNIEEGESFAAVYINGDRYKDGDYYHNKISDTTDGFIEGLKYCGVKVEEERIYMQKVYKERGRISDYAENYYSPSKLNEIFLEELVLIVIPEKQKELKKALIDFSVLRGRVVIKRRLQEALEFVDSIQSVNDIKLIYLKYDS